MKKIHPGNQKLPPRTGQPNCQNLAVWPVCVRWQLLIPWMDFFHFSVLAFLQGLSKCFHLNLPLYFFFTLWILQTHSVGQGGPDPNTSPQRGVCPPHYCPHPKITYARYLCTKYETRCRNDLPHVSHANGRSPE